MYHQTCFVLPTYIHPNSQSSFFNLSKTLRVTFISNRKCQEKDTTPVYRPKVNRLE